MYAISSAIEMEKSDPARAVPLRSVTSHEKSGTRAPLTALLSETL